MRSNTPRRSPRALPLTRTIWPVIRSPWIALGGEATEIVGDFEGLGRFGRANQDGRMSTDDADEAGRLRRRAKCAAFVPEGSASIGRRRGKPVFNPGGNP
jgi:hypothetical protein